MMGKTSFRNTLLLTLEAQIITLFLFLTAFLPFTFKEGIGLFICISLLFAIGTCCYEKINQKFVGLLMLYGMVALVGIVAFLYFNSMLLALLGAGIYYWRLHAITDHDVILPDLMKRFTIIMLAYAYFLLFQKLSADPHLGDTPLLLTVSMIWFLMICYMEFITRYKRMSLTSGGTLSILVTQHWGLETLLLGAYVVGASLVYSLVSLGWGLLLGPIGTVAKNLLTPILLWLDRVIQNLQEMASSNSSLTNYLDDQKPEDKNWEAPLDNRDDILSLLEPYLISAFVILILVFLSWKIWKHSHQKKKQYIQSNMFSPATTQIDKLNQSAKSTKEDSQKELQTWKVQKEDSIRYAYYQFLMHMGKEEFLIYPEETSSEYLHRLQSICPNQQMVELAKRITTAYEAHRYAGVTLSEQEIALLQADVGQLCSLSKTLSYSLSDHK
ncbi:DUF4129 domain-containing protein [Brevibacillus laterosporus]|uniref:DUF4129 domain-containing protein n=1 Tax=Brevibacillus laterosporus TaxID=1465 RepID=UPI0018CEC635|nr:DUF4129 domain-containing protein [Brevibacillus laterosporus]MBG9787404.1 hypothetical protein [Brevibacillus laterosporus]